MARIVDSTPAKARPSCRPGRSVASPFRPAEQNRRGHHDEDEIAQPSHFERGQAVCQELGRRVRNRKQGRACKQRKHRDERSLARRRGSSFIDGHRLGNDRQVGCRGPRTARPVWLKARLRHLPGHPAFQVRANPLLHGKSHNRSPELRPSVYLELDRSLQQVVKLLVAHRCPALSACCRRALASAAQDGFASAADAPGVRQRWTTPALPTQTIRPARSAAAAIMVRSERSRDRSMDCAAVAFSRPSRFSTFLSSSAATARWPLASSSCSAQFDRGVLQIVTTDPGCPRVSRISEMARIGDAGALLLGCDLAIEIARHAREIGNHGLDLRRHGDAAPRVGTV